MCLKVNITDGKSQCAYCHEKHGGKGEGVGAMKVFYLGVTFEYNRFQAIYLLALITTDVIKIRDLISALSKLFGILLIDAFERMVTLHHERK